MERAIQEMEKIKRAEQIYSRRKGLENEEKKPKNIYKFLFEILVLINIAVIVLAVQNQKYIFTEDFIKKVNSYNVNIKSKIENIVSDKDDTISGESNDASSAILVENDPETSPSTSQDPQSETQLNQPTQSPETLLNISQTTPQDPTQTVSQTNTQELSQEEKDILEIKENYSVILPVNGVKTSGFGERESTNSKVTKNHTGVDIATNLGTAISSATSGKVIEVSSKGDYGKHFRVQTGDLVTLYAHCSKIYVKEGQDINQGDKVAEVGSTGNSTGPHLHLEFRLHDRLVNPEKILSI